jgi:hypothetical protein
MGDIPSRDAHAEFQGYLDTDSLAQPEVNLDMNFHSFKINFPPAVDGSSSSCVLQQQVENPTSAVPLMDHPG